MDILFTDLDNTLIYSKKIDIEDKISVEIYDGDDNSFMSRYSYELLHRLNKSILFVPVTTRTIIQYSRIEFGILPRYSLCANGGVLLENGIVSEDWYKESLSIVKDSRNEKQKAFNFLEKDKRRKFECRDIYELFIFTKCDSMESVVYDLKRLLNTELVDILYNKDKLYIMPKALNKANMIKRFLVKFGFGKDNDIIFAAGDTKFDISMIELADIGFAHKDLKINNKNIFNDYEGLFSDFYLEKIMKYIKE